MSLSLALTHDVCMEPLGSRHAAAAFQVVDRHRVALGRFMRWVDETRNVQDMAHRLTRAAEGNGLWAGLFWRGEIVGAVVLKDVHDGQAEVGYWIVETFEGRGLVTQACRALEAHAFDELGLTRLEIQCCEANGRSRAVAVRLGYQMEKTLPDACFIRGRWHDLVVYGKTRAHR